MGTIATELQRIISAKASIKSSIEGKGVTVPSSAKIDDYSDYVDAIEQGGGETEAPFKDVCFYDYDGKRLYSYTAAEALALTALPALPTNHSAEGITPEEWNYTLAEMQEEVRVQGVCDVGVTYITNDGRSHIHIHLDDPAYLSPAINYSAASIRPVTVDWGDGSEEETITSNPIKHTYASTGDYVIKVAFGGSREISGGILYDGDALANVASVIYNLSIKKMFLANFSSSVNTYNNTDALVIFSKTVSWRTNGQYALTRLKTPVLILPKTIDKSVYKNFSASYKVASFPPVAATSEDNIGSFSLSDYGNIRTVIPHTVQYLQTVTVGVSPMLYTTYGGILPGNAFSGRWFDKTRIFGVNVTSIGGSAFSNNYALREISFPANTVVPTLSNTNAFNNVPKGCVIRVPESLYNDWIAATNWVTLYESEALVFEKILGI